MTLNYLNKIILVSNKELLNIHINKLIRVFMSFDIKLEIG